MLIIVLSSREGLLLYLPPQFVQAMFSLLGRKVAW